MKVAIIYDPDPDLGPDPLDETAKADRRLGEFVDDNHDVLVIWRELGDQFEGGSRTHVIGQGVWENLTVEQIDEALGAIDADGLDGLEGEPG